MYDADKTRITISVSSVSMLTRDKNYDDTWSRFHMVSERSGRTDRQTDLLYQYRESVCWRAMKTICCFNFIKP